MLIYFKERDIIPQSNLCLSVYNLTDDNPYQFFWHSSSEKVSFLQDINNNIKLNAKIRYTEPKYSDDASEAVFFHRYRSSYFGGFENMEFIDDIIERMRADFAQCLGVENKEISLLGVERYNKLKWHTDIFAAGRSEGLRIAFPIFGKGTSFMPITEEKLDQVHLFTPEELQLGQAAAFITGKHGTVHDGPAGDGSRLTIILSCKDICMDKASFIGVMDSHE